MSLLPEQRKQFIDFISKHACDDIIIQVMNRVTSNIEDTKTLEAFIKARSSIVPTADMLSAAGRASLAAEKPKFSDGSEVDPKVYEKAVTTELQKRIDLGEPCKKLGKNGQDILTYLQQGKRGTIDHIRGTLKLPEAKIKPMLALLLARGQIQWVGGDSWEAK